MGVDDVASGCAWSSVSATCRPLSRAKSPDWLRTIVMPDWALIASSKPFLRSLAGEEPVVPSSSMILALPLTVLDQPFGDALALLDEIRADEGHVVLAGLGQR